MHWRWLALVHYLQDPAISYGFYLLANLDPFDMSDDRFTETTSTGWFSRLGSSITGILIGGVLLVISTGVLWWNEGRSVATARGLAEGAKVTLEAEADMVDPAKEGKLVHVIGQTTLEGPAADEAFGIAGPDLVKVRRVVEVFQWVETTQQTTRTKLGGGEETVTEYRYETKWDDELHDSGNFKRPDGHQNPKAKVAAADFQAEAVSLGAFRLPDFLLSQWNDFQPHTLPDPDKLSEDLRELATVQEKWLVLSKKPAAPVPGDARVQFESMKPGEVSVLARQVKDTFEEYTTQQDTKIGRLAIGAQSTEAMYAAAKTENTIMGWLLRLGGFLAMLFGFILLFNPLKVLADVLPWAGKVVGAGTGFIALLLSLAGSLTIISVAWVWYRPLLGITLLVVVGGLVYWLKIAVKNKASIPPPIPAK